MEGCKAEQPSAQGQALERELPWKCPEVVRRPQRLILCLELEKQWDEKKRLDVNNFRRWN